MTDEALLVVAESVLMQAIDEAEFTNKPKDVAFVQDVAQKTEKLRAKIAGREPVQISVSLVNGRIHTLYSVSRLSKFTTL